MSENQHLRKKSIGVFKPSKNQSKKFLVKRFEKDFAEICDSFSLNINSEIDMQLVQQILRSMGFVTDS